MTLKFLLGLNKNLDEDRGRVMGTKPILRLREAFSYFNREESKGKKVTMSSQHPSPTLKGSALAAYGSRLQNLQDTHPQKKGRPWCDHYAKHGHTKDMLDTVNQLSGSHQNQILT